MNTISVVGGGIAGMALAAALDPSRWDVTIFEQAPTKPPAGTGLAMWPDVMAALDGIGAGEDVRDASLRIDRFEVCDRDRRPIMVNTSQVAQLVMRPQLLAALRAAVPDTARWQPARVADPEELHADVLVGADGVHSVVRRRLFDGETAARKVGSVAFRGLSPIPTDRMVEIWQDGALCGLAPTATGESNWYLACRDEPPYDAIESLDDAAAHRLGVELAGRFGAQAQDVIAATVPHQLLRQDIWVAPPRRRMVEGRAVLVGDAAHAMCPNLGRGACESILDAVTLGAALSTMDPDDALRHYQRTRSRRTQRIRRVSRAVLGVSTMRRGAGLRNALLRMGPGRAAREPATA